MNINLKLILALIYIFFLGALIFFIFSYLDFKNLNDYHYIKEGSESLLNWRDENLFLFIFFFLVFSTLWIFFLGFAGPIAILSGFIFGQWIGTIVSVISFSIGSTLLYVFARHYLRDLIINRLENKIEKYKNLFKKNEFIYFMIFRFAGGAGIPFGIQNILPVIFDMKIKNYFYATFLGLFPSIFIISSLGSGFEKLIAKNESLSYLNVIFDPEIYWPIIGFIAILIVSFFIKKRLFKK